MSHTSIEHDSSQNPAHRSKLPVVWLGESNDLLAALSPRFVTCHVTTEDATLHALEHGLATCLIIDLPTIELDIITLLNKIRAHWADTHIITLNNLIVTPPPIEVDHVIARDRDPDGIEAEIADYTRENILPPQPPALNDYYVLQERTRHLEGLVQASFTFSANDDIESLLNDINMMGRVAVGADAIAVLLTDDDYATLSDSLNLGVPDNYLALCSEHLGSLDIAQRVMYLGDEILLRERTVTPTSPIPLRMREAQAARAWSYMRLPLNIDQKLAGIVAFFSQTPGQFDGAHLQLGRLFTMQVATALRNAQLYLRLTSAETRQRVVTDVAQLLAEDLELNDVLTRIVEQAAMLVQADHGSIYLVQPDRSLKISAIFNHEETWMGRTIEPGVGQSGMIAVTGRPSIVNRYDTWSHANPQILDELGGEVTLIGVPLNYRGLVLGVLQVAFAPPREDGTETARNMLMMLAPQAAIAIAKAQLHEAVRQEQRQLQAILDHTPANVLVCDPNGTILRANPQTERLLTELKLPKHNIVGNNIWRILNDLLPPTVDISQFALNQPIEISLGDLGEYLITVAPVQKNNGAVEAYVAVGQNVTALRRLDQMRGNLHRVLTHDLGNLIMLARGPLDLLDEPDISPAQRDELRSMLSSSLIRMEDLISDVTTLEMADSLGQETFTPYNLEKLVQRVIRRNQDNAKASNITLTYETVKLPTKSLRGHAVLIMQAVDNLVSNAIKYTPPGGKVDVSLDAEHNFAVVTVKDTGFGIPEEELENIFKPFVRIHDEVRRHIPGTGLGLSLVKAFVDTHGGHVTVESEVGVGSTFTISLPINSLAAPRSIDGGVPHLDLSAHVNTHD